MTNKKNILAELAFLSNLYYLTKLSNTTNKIISNNYKRKIQIFPL